MSTVQRPVHGVDRRLRIAAILLGFAVSGLSGWCMMTGRGGLFALLAKLFYPGLFASLIAMRAINTSTIVMSFLLNAVFYLLVFFFVFRWRRIARPGRNDLSLSLPRTDSKSSCPSEARLRGCR